MAPRKSRYRASLSVVRICSTQDGVASSWEGRDAVGFEHKFWEIGGGGRMVDGHVDVPPVGGGNEAAVSSGRPRVPSEGATGAKLGDRLPGSNPE